MKKKYQPHGFAARLTPGWEKYQARLFTVRAARAAGQVKRVSVRRRTTSQRGAATRSSGASGDGNPDDPDPERPIPAAHQLYDQAALADLLILSKKSVQNIYSATPHLLPPAIKIPGARGPRWTSQAIDEWLATRPQHTPKPIPQLTRKKVGRPRIALVKQGGASC